MAAAAHLARLGASVAELYGASLPADLGRADRARRRRRTPVPAACASTYVPGDAEPARSSVRPFDPTARRRTLAPVTVPGGIGAHKWIDRRLLDALAEQVAPALPLLVDLDGYVLESWGANVFARLPGGDAGHAAAGRAHPAGRGPRAAAGGARRARASSG